MDTEKCPACGMDISIDNIDVNDNEEDGYGEMLVYFTCPHCNADLTAHFDAQDGYNFMYLEED